MCDKLNDERGYQSGLAFMEQCYFLQRRRTDYLLFTEPTKEVLIPLVLNSVLVIAINNVS